MISLSRSWQETWTALKSWPDKEKWGAAIKVALPSLAIIAGIGFISGWLHWYPQDRWQEYVKAILVGIFLIALPFELIFRGLLLSTLAQVIARWAAWISTGLFVVYFPILGYVNQTKWNGAFQMPSFWFSMLILGIILSHIRIRSGSLWSVILIHGLAAATWMAFLGGRSY